MKMSPLNQNTKMLSETEPERFVEKVIKDFARSCSQNHLESFAHEPIFGMPLVGFADGDDHLFEEYKHVVHEKHLLPREALALSRAAKENHPQPNPEHVSVISFIFPINRTTIRVNAGEKEGPCLRWNHTRWQGQAFVNALSAYLVSRLEKLGYDAVAPELENFYHISMSPQGFASNWSQRHAAYAAGLGTFSLNDGFITAKGQAMRCGSVVTSMKLQPSLRPYTNYLENCLFYTTGKCGKCICRCPGGALSEKGHDKLKCFEIVFEKQKPWMEGAHGPGFIGSYAGCGLCQTGVPCATLIPVRRIAAEKKLKNRSMVY